MRIDVIAGARPNFIKIASIIRAFEAHRKEGGRLRYRLIHTGQHYDTRMSGDFFSQLGIPDPELNLEAGPGSHAEQTAAIMIGYERVLAASRSELCLVVGDVTSTMACAITAKKMLLMVAHVEGGIRSGDMTMPEEVNRVTTDALSDYFFTTSEYANKNLHRAGVGAERIFFVGNTMIDTLLANAHRLVKPACWNAFGLANGGYFVVTLHRPSNVDAQGNLEALLRAICAAANGLPVVFPVHPRTALTLRSLESLPPNLHVLDPQPYLEFNYLMKHAKAIVTDSGGITEEATAMGVPCMTLRNSTERPETIAVGTNELLGTDPAAIAPAFARLFAGSWKRGGIPEKWDGESGSRIVAVLDLVLPR